MIGNRDYGELRRKYKDRGTMREGNSHGERKIGREREWGRERERKGGHSYTGQKGR